jgi:hypothetical protein
MSPLRRRMINDMQIRHLSAHTQRAYVTQVFRFACHFRKSPEHLGPTEIRTYLIHLTQERCLSTSSTIVTVSALRFFYTVTLKRPWAVEDIPTAPRLKQTLISGNMTAGKSAHDEIIKRGSGVRAFAHPTDHDCVTLSDEIGRSFDAEIGERFPKLRHECLERHRANPQRMPRMVEEDVTRRELVDDGEIIVFTLEVREPPVDDRLILLFFVGKGWRVRRHLGEAIYAHCRGSRVRRLAPCASRCASVFQPVVASALSKSVVVAVLDSNVALIDLRAIAFMVLLLCHRRHRCRTALTLRSLRLNR